MQSFGHRSAKAGHQVQCEENAKGNQLHQEESKCQPDLKTPEVLTFMYEGTQPELPQQLNDVFSGTAWGKVKKDFHWMPHEEPHLRRRKAIMEKYGKQIRELEQKKEPLTFWITAAVAVVQITIAAALRNSDWWLTLLVAYTAGAILNHMTQVLVHDLTHHTAFHNPFWNKIGAIMCNLPTLVPSGIAFGIYHNDHHLGLGRTDRDTDLPSNWEIEFFSTPAKKFLYLCLLPFFYGLRPMILFPHVPTKWELANIVIIFTSDFLIYYNFGWGAIIYLILSTYFSLGPHPCAMHFIAEHYEFVKGQETYNYYGIMNIFNLNLGYHMEHHDFPWIPWNQLPKVHAIAKEFYDTVPFHTSYIQVGLKYIFDSEIGAFARGTYNIAVQNAQLTMSQNFDDLYVVIKTAQNMQLTSICKKSANHPKWRDVLSIRVTEEQYLDIELWDYLQDSELLGSTTLPLQEAFERKRVQENLKILSNNQIIGHLQLTIEYQREQLYASSTDSESNSNANHNSSSLNLQNEMQEEQKTVVLAPTQVQTQFQVQPQQVQYSAQINLQQQQPLQKKQQNATVNPTQQIVAGPTPVFKQQANPAALYAQQYHYHAQIGNVQNSTNLRMKAHGPTIQPQVQPQFFQPQQVPVPYGAQRIVMRGPQVHPSSSAQAFFPGTRQLRHF